MPYGVPLILDHHGYPKPDQIRARLCHSNFVSMEKRYSQRLEQRGKSSLA